ncbi:MAG TPA: DUF6084 family protein [Acidimicrobiia bacterium]|nr:DUF6084 family protein [Acidimicrobiia bacterium]
MSELSFDCVDAAADPYAVAPTVVFRLRIAETTGQPIGGIMLRAQFRIEPLKRRYSDAEAERIGDLFGERARWGDTMKPMQFANVTQMVPAFSRSVEVDLPVPLTYDFDVATAKYFHGLEEGEIPFIILFSGTALLDQGGTLSIEQIPWHKETAYRLPVKVWREVMDQHFPNSSWVRIRRDTLDSLQRFKSRLTLPTWDDTIEALLKRAEHT